MTIDIMREFFLWCSILNVGVLIVSVLFMWLFHDLSYRVHRTWCNVSVDTFDAILLSVLAFYKIIIVVFNIVPYFVLRFVV